MADKTLWLNVYTDGGSTLHLSRKRADNSILVAHRIGPAVQVDLIHTPDGWKQDDRRGRIEGMKEALNLGYNHLDACSRMYENWKKLMQERIAQLEKEMADGH